MSLYNKFLVYKKIDTKIERGKTTFYTFNKNLKNYDHIFRYEEKNLKKSFGFFLRTFFAFV